MERAYLTHLLTISLIGALFSMVAYSQDNPAVTLAPAKDNQAITKPLSADGDSSKQNAPVAQTERLQPANNESPNPAEITTDSELSTESKAQIVADTELPTKTEAKATPIKTVKSDIIDKSEKKNNPAPSAPSIVDIIQLEDHMKNKNFSLGYQLAQKILPDWEGDSTFDFLYGVHAIETGHYDEATFVFERLTLLNPKTNRFRLELARALYFNKNLDTAQAEFKKVLASNPPENVKNNIQGFLSKIQKSKEKDSHNWLVGFGINGGFDSNINGGTEEDGIDFPSIGFVSLQEEAQSQSSAFTQFFTRALYSYSHKKHHSLDVGINTNHKRNSEVSTYDLDVMNLSGHYSWQPYQSIRIQGGLNLSNVKLDGEAYQNQNTLNGMFLYTRSNGFSLSANLNFGSRSSESPSAPDADVSLYAFSVIWPSSAYKSTNLSLYLSSDDVSNTELSHFGKTLIGVNYGTRLLITPSIVRSMVISLSSTEYQAEMPIFDEVRTDTGIMAAWGYDWSLAKFLTLNANLTVSHNASNIDLYTTYRAIFNTGISMQF